MKYIFIIFLINYSCSFGQTSSFERSQKWKLYDVAGSNLFKYSTDTLKRFSFYNLNDDSVRDFLKGIREIPADDAPVWMGAPHIATYEIDGLINKVDISLYGGFFFDEKSKKYFQLPNNNIDSWHSYIRECFVSFHKGH